MLGPLGAAVGQGTTATNPTHHAHCAPHAFWPISVQQVQGSQAACSRIGGHAGPRTVRRVGGMQSRGALLVMEVEQLGQWQSSTSELKCGRLSMLADWSLALRSGPTCSASICPKPCSFVSLLGPSHLDSASVAFAEGQLDHDACPALFEPVCKPRADHGMITAAMSDDGGGTTRARNCPSFAVVWRWLAEASEHRPCDVTDMQVQASKL